MSEKIFIKSESRGYANHGWLKANHYFSFARYYNPDRMGFGTLRVINDDTISPSNGFETHPHDNMEIITIPLSGELTHTDSNGNKEVISPGEVQVMSAGTGIWHSEFNNSNSNEVKLFQIWITPDKAGYEPRYDQKKFSFENEEGKINLLVCPKNFGGPLWINQNAFISKLKLNRNNSADYKKFDKTNGIFIINIDGDFNIGADNLKRRDALGLVENDLLTVEAKENSEILILEIPME